MEYPDLVRSRLEDERVLDRVGLGGGDAVLVTPTRTLVYRAEGLLSDESVSAYPHDVERVELESGRRKTTFRLAYVDGVREFTVPSGSTREVLVPLLAGVLRTAGVLGADESVLDAYRFSELTLVVAAERVVKHVGGAVWDEEFEVAPYADLTGLEFEEGSVATEVSLEVDGYPQRVKVPNEHAGTVRRTIQEAVFEFHGVSSLAELEAAVAVADGDDRGEGEETEGDVFEESGFTGLLADEGDGTEERAGDADGGAEAVDEGEGDASGTGADPFPADGRGEESILDPVRRNAAGVADGPDASPGGAEGGRGDDANAGEVPVDVATRVEELTAAVERQNDLLERQEEVLQQLVDELRRGR